MYKYGISTVCPFKTIRVWSSYYQIKHQSEAVWRGTLQGENAGLTVWREDNDFWQHVINHPFHPRLLNCFSLCGFRRVIDVGYVPNDYSLITALIERWRPKTHTFHLRTGEATITLRHLQLLHTPPSLGECFPSNTLCVTLISPCKAWQCPRLALNI